MNWSRELFDLYEKNEKLAGIVERGRYGEPLVLLPLFHTTVAAQITVGINLEGDFLYGNQVMEEDKMTVIPVTEKSAARTAGVEPHPLCDNLKYLAGDYMEYVISEKGKNFSENHRRYMEQLERWATSSDSHDKVIAVWKYLQKGTLIYNLIQYGVLKTDASGKVPDTEKIQKIAQTECFVRFVIEEKWSDQMNLLKGGEEAIIPECWKDLSLMKAYISYCRSLEMPRGLSYLSGENMQLAYLQPKKIRNEGDGAKLISANDETNFTFRGRFVTKEEAFSVGYEDSQKVHNALKWIIRKQGRNWNGLTVVTWESDLKELPDWSLDTDRICESYESNDSWEEDEETEQVYGGTNAKDAARFQHAITGYRKKLDFDSRMVLMVFNAATTGRLALMEYQALSSSTYLNNLRDWHDSCEWIFPKYKDKSYYEYHGMTGVKDMANLLYGVESNGEMVLKGSSEKLYAEVCRRMIPCIILGKNVPEDMVQVAFHRASAPLSYENRYHWRRTLSLACALIKKKYREHKKEEWTMALDKESDDRDYLYGRLLAVAERIEYRTMEKGEERDTNAKRYMNNFSQQPFRTWKVIEERIQPYYSKLSVGERIIYQNLLDEIQWRFKKGEFERNDALNGLYLLGYHNQAYAMRNNQEKNEEVAADE
ncbi:MAG: type I-C CRISPR-associated protein Cas8c/Csd1 [Lachnospiraceae bacterium]|nr:type I-C CRISPR-associated protein Cas8c/Csd1 [Lachnospiraceae bacterium]